MTTSPAPGAPTGLRLRPLDPNSEADTTAVAELIEADPGYTQRAEGRNPEPDDAEGLLGDVPPGLAPSDKVVLGAFESDRLVAVVDLIRGWPTSGTSLIGLLQVHTAHQGRGLGRIVHDLSLEWVTRNWPETRSMRAVIVTPNAAHADPFWRAMGYQPEGESVSYTGARVQTTAQPWVRRLASV